MNLNQSGEFATAALLRLVPARMLRKPVDSSRATEFPACASHGRGFYRIDGLHKYGDPEDAMSKSSSTETGQEFVAALCEQACKHRAVNHPYLQQLISGDVPDVKGALKDFVFQYSAYSLDFMRYLTATIAQLENGGHRKALMKNLVEETGRIDKENAALLGTIGIELEWVDGIPHPELFSRYLNAVGVDEEFRRLNEYSDEAIIWRDLFFSLCSKEGPARALGAIGLGTENIVKHIYRPLVEAIERHLDITLRDRVFFDLHVALDDQHGDTLTDVAVDYAISAENRRLLKEGMLMALSIRGSFFDSLQARAHAMIPVRSVNASHSKHAGKH